ncbi:UDP-N-acetylmuramoyl-tripeptide--D-alanyl-D-alanine ligase [Flavobacterium azooxidireducens]|uniref:UDP-N-acetylmuramoyl-tripeptide--D-alanyl-D-alanine ligase n=1 Tax=Flavobacterium azooxidireducens TaxID=1871076 RepID=A0ABY4KGA6_9FLAO|nr:UDP-N-acetylmuramoyl-tripeptide--D-alanyl-D-alanine ligase [Flavobacterium azooxidireducens]UPQ79832.1 UDP-N-acetylmuramoyl-tripeptide--D-alanyl-D-alanine ligase [Flavobacterium azooxidireducens]
MDISQIHARFLECSSVSIDTRRIEKNSFFVALKGTSFDANSFAKEALEKGASYVLIDDKEFFLDERTILVSNTLETLQELAKFHRNYLNLPIIALTGSNGKTTTKELFQVVLSQKYNTKSTLGNLNNHIGVPLTLLSFTKETEIGIVEMGANHQKEIDFLCKIAQPDYGYITNFGKAHLEGFGGVEGVIKGKSEMYDYLSQHNKKVFVNLDDPIQSEKTAQMEQITFSTSNPDSFVFIKNVEANPFVKVNYNEIEIQSNLIGLYNATNIIAAITVGKYFNVVINDSKQALENYNPDNNRSQIIHKNSNKIILDAYNANPSSMEVALQNFIQLENKTKIAVLGDMFELGEESPQEHKNIIKKLSSTANFNCYLIGKEFYAVKENHQHLHFFPTFDEFAAQLKSNPFQNSFLLIKGSRGMALERTLQYI